MEAMAGLTQSLWIPKYLPPTLNALTKRFKHWAPGAKLKAECSAMVAGYAAKYRIERATGPRRFSLILIHPPGKRFADRDAWAKAIKDALKLCGALIDDSARLCHDGPVSYARAAENEEWGTLILLEDL